MTYGHLQADCLYTGISSGPNARCRVWEAFTFFNSGPVTQRINSKQKDNKQGRAKEVGHLKVGRWCLCIILNRSAVSTGTACRWCRKRCGLADVLPRSLVGCTASELVTGRDGDVDRTLRRRLSRHVDETLRATNKAGRPLTSLQMKLHYLRIVSQLPSYGTRYFLVRTSTTVCVVRRIARLIDGRHSSNALSCTERQLLRLAVLKSENSRHLFAFCKSGKKR